MATRVRLAALMVAASSGIAGAADYAGTPLQAYRTRTMVQREILPRHVRRVPVAEVGGCDCLDLPWGGLRETWIDDDLPWGGLHPPCAPTRRTKRVVLIRKG
jgi:hypothetical protein